MQVDCAVFRAAFSHIPFWHGLLDDMAIISQHTGPRGPGMYPSAPSQVSKSDIHGLDRTLTDAQLDEQGKSISLYGRVCTDSMVVLRVEAAMQMVHTRTHSGVLLCKVQSCVVHISS